MSVGLCIFGFGFIQAEEKIVKVDGYRIPVLLNTSQEKKAREWRGTIQSLIPKIKSMTNQKWTSSILKRIQVEEAKLPIRVEEHNTLTRVKFIRPLAETDLSKLRTGIRVKQYHTVADALPGLGSMALKESAMFKVLYDNKERKLLEDVNKRRRESWDWEIYYDCDTILDIGNPKAEAGKKILLIQANMDIDADGSDGKRFPESDSYPHDRWFQPETSYRWDEKVKVENPFLDVALLKQKDALDRSAYLKEQLKKWEALSGKHGVKIASEISKIKSELEDLNRKKEAILDKGGAIVQANDRIFSLTQQRHLIGTKDPFIVVPLSLSYLPKTSSSAEFTPQVGDYAVVMYGNRLYPALVADEGPMHKCGEASLFLAEQIFKHSGQKGSGPSPAATPFYYLDISYIIFPGTAEKQSEWGTPDLQELNEKCRQYLDGVGGVAKGFTLHQW